MKDLEHASASNGKRLEKTEEEAVELRRRLLGDQAIQMILSGLIEGSVEKIEPIFDSERMPRYLIVENIAKAGLAEAKALLERMKDAGILTKVFYEREVLCPDCKSPAGIFIHHKCPKCSTLEIDRIDIWEHSKCGSVWETKTLPEETTCPKCHAKTTSDAAAFHVIGISWLCRKCSTKFDRPDQTFFCRGCNRESRVGEVRMLDVYSYSFNPDVKKEVQDALLLPILKKTLEESGFRVEMPGSLVGDSGIPQDFTIVARKDDECLVADLVQSDEAVDVTSVLTLSAKLSDVKTKAGMLLTIPSISDRAKAFAISRGLVVIEGKEIKEVAAKLQNFLAKK